MLGIPGQTQEHVNNLRDFIARNRPGKVTLFFFTPYPGTKAESKFGSGDLDPANLDMFDDEKHVFYGGECEVNPRSVFDEITAFCASIGVG
jgi:coproporphyrinogen III oxidase-like Fe-S oxidoreductase